MTDLITLAEARRVPSRVCYALPTATCLYRLYDDAGTLLYVGVTSQAVTYRMSGHARKPWWPLVTHVQLEQFDRRVDALAAETFAIKSEIPLHNIVHDSRRIPARLRNGSRVIRESFVLSRTRAEQGAGSREVGAGMNVATAIHSQVSAHERMDGVNRCR